MNFVFLISLNSMKRKGVEGWMVKCYERFTKELEGFEKVKDSRSEMELSNAT